MTDHHKILELDTLANRLQDLKNQGKRVVLCHGVFDLLHVGHIRYFNSSKKFGDVLVVTLTPDAYVNKGPSRPAFPHDLRAESIAALDAVDFVAVNRWPTAVETIKLLKPDVYAKGPDYKDAQKDVTGGITREEDAVKSVGGSIQFTDDITFSSSNLLNKFMPMYSPALKGYIDAFRHRHDVGEIMNGLESLLPLKVLVLGDVILDEYVYCNALGKSSKEPILALKYISRELHAGGSLAIANHLSEFCSEVHLLSYLGAEKPQEKFVHDNLHRKVKSFFVSKPESPTIVKRRYLDKYLLSKVLEIYEINDDPLVGEAEDKLCAELERLIPQVDVVLVADFGHGLVTERMVEIVARKAKFLAVNAQTNAANLGYHTISKYPRADYVCIQEGEVRLDHRNRNGDLNSIITQMAERLHADTVMITRGKNGTLLYKNGRGFFECPSFAVKIVDRIGAGDAVLSVTSLCVAAGIDPEVTGLIANMIGAQAVTIVGNSRSVERAGLIKAIDSILK